MKNEGAIVVGLKRRFASILNLKKIVLRVFMTIIFVNSQLSRNGHLL